MLNNDKIDKKLSIDYYDSFRKLYYHMYSNSSASRAERIISDISKLLLIALNDFSESDSLVIENFLDNKSSANNSLMPLILKKYANIYTEHDNFGVDDTSLRYGLSEIYSLNLSNAPSHLLGDAFQALIGPNLRGDKGQFFTPKSVVKCMVDIIKPDANSKVIDPACGTGGFLSEVVSFWDSNKLERGKVIGIDKDKDLFLLTSSLLRISNPKKSYVLNQNSLDVDILKKLPSNSSPYEADYVLTNPPFGSKIPVKDSKILSNFKLGYIWEYSKTEKKWKQTEKLRSIQDPQTLFIELCISFLKENGKMGIVLPEGIFGNKTCGYIWDFIREEGNIIGLIDCPRTTFQPGTDTKTNILFFEKNKVRSESKTKVAVAINCGHDCRGKMINNEGIPFSDDFKNIAKDWHSKKNEYSFDTKITNPYYLVPRYYDKKKNNILKNEANEFNGKLISFQEMIKKGWISIKKGHEVGSDSYGTGDIPFVRTSDISNFEISMDPNKSVSESVYNSFKNTQQLKTGDILMVVDGRYRIGRCAILHDFTSKCIAQSHLKIISVNEEISPINSFELLYLLSLKSVQYEIRSLVFIQSTLGSIGTRINEIKIPMPIEKSDYFLKKVHDFKESICQRAKLLSKLKEYEDYSIEV